MIEHTALEQILAPGALRTEFQPIVRVTNDGIELFALEALTRGPANTNMARADVLFEYTRRKQQESLVDHACVSKALGAAMLLDTDARITVNVHAATMASVPSFAAWLAASSISHGIEPSRLIVEIVEHATPRRPEAFRDSLAMLRESGICIAIDDLGAGDSNYQMLVECRPEFLKIDRTLVLGCSTDLYRGAVLKSVVTLAQSCGSQVIAEGVENDADLAVVRGLGIDLVQGWLFSPSLPAEELAAAWLHPVTASYMQQVPA
jgi:EAL domain-containing protein (putative c-di-GMP-specific phosphodiesterase class I)